MKYRFLIITIILASLLNIQSIQSEDINCKWEISSKYKNTWNVLRYYNADTNETLKLVVLPRVQIIDVKRPDKKSIIQYKIFIDKETEKFQVKKVNNKNIYKIKAISIEEYSKKEPVEVLVALKTSKRTIYNPVVLEYNDLCRGAKELTFKLCCNEIPENILTTYDINHDLFVEKQFSLDTELITAISDNILENKSKEIEIELPNEDLENSDESKTAFLISDNKMNEIEAKYTQNENDKKESDAKESEESDTKESDTEEEIKNTIKVITFHDYIKNLKKEIFHKKWLVDNDNINENLKKEIKDNKTENSENPESQSEKQSIEDSDTKLNKWFDNDFFKDKKLNEKRKLFTIISMTILSSTIESEDFNTKWISFLEENNISTVSKELKNNKAENLEEKDSQNNDEKIAEKENEIDPKIEMKKKAELFVKFYNKYEINIEQLRNLSTEILNNYEKNINISCVNPESLIFQSKSEKQENLKKKYKNVLYITDSPQFVKNIKKNEVIDFTAIKDSYVYKWEETIDKFLDKGIFRIIEENSITVRPVRTKIIDYASDAHYHKLRYYIVNPGELFDSENVEEIRNKGKILNFRTEFKKAGKLYIWSDLGITRIDEHFLLIEKMENMTPLGIQVKDVIQKVNQFVYNNGVKESLDNEESSENKKISNNEKAHDNEINIDTEQYPAYIILQRELDFIKNENIFSVSSEKKIDEIELPDKKRIVSVKDIEKLYNKHDEKIKNKNNPKIETSNDNKDASIDASKDTSKDTSKDDSFKSWFCRGYGCCVMNYQRTR